MTVTFRSASHWRERVSGWSERITGAWLDRARVSARPLARHLRDHFYTLAGFGCLAGAAFTHSLFSGLLVLGSLLLVLEWKVGELWAVGSCWIHAGTGSGVRSGSCTPSWRTMRCRRVSRLSPRMVAR